MFATCKSIARELTPPVIWKTASRLRVTAGVKLRRWFPFVDKDASWYNRHFHTSEGYRKHYTLSSYYFLWTVIVDRLLRLDVRSVLDIGCGPGQFASLLRDRGIPSYYGIDLSDEAVRIAERLCPEYRFHCGSIFESEAIETQNYDVAIATEFLEHVQEDLKVLEQIPKGKKFIGTVPDFLGPSHVRCFTSCKEVEDRYGPLFESFRVDAVLANEKGKTFYLLEGVRA